MEREKAAYRDEKLQPASGELQLRMLFSGISRGTERLVYRGQVPPEEHDTMRAPFQEGAFSFPVKYGYAAVGQVQMGPRAGETLFALFPHQTLFYIPETAGTPIPAHIPPQRAVLAANMETALNITWDAQMNIGDRIVVVGCGVVGALAAYLAAQVPGTEVTLTDIDPAKQIIAKNLGCQFALPGDLTVEADVVIHASAAAAGLETAISIAGVEARIIEASWYGSQRVYAPLGGRFHQRRLQIISSQVGRIPASHAARWTYQRRMAKAVSLLADPSLDILISGETGFDDLAANYGDILAAPSTLCHRVAYD